jgi:formylglycine-generating enzyme required for sulfatase activity
MVSSNIDTECEVQDKRLKITPSNAETVSLSSGTSRIVCRAPGYEDAVRNVMVESGEMLFVHMCLVPKAQSYISNPESGRVKAIEPIPGLYIEKSRPRILQFDAPTNRELREEGTLEIQRRPASRPMRQELDVQPTLATVTPKALDFVWFGGGRSHCSDDDDDCEDAAPATRPFWLTRNTITAGEYALCVRAGACTEPIREGRCAWGTGRSDSAMNCVDWRQAKQFCEWSGARLPTIEEWELAALGEKPKVDARISDPSEFRRGDDSIDDDMSMDALDRDGRTMAKAARATLSRAARQTLIKVVPQGWEWTSTSSGSKKVLTGLTQTNSPWPSPSRRYSSMTFADDAVGFRCAK